MASILGIFRRASASNTDRSRREENDLAKKASVDLLQRQRSDGSSPLSRESSESMEGKKKLTRRIDTISTEGADSQEEAEYATPPHRSHSVTPPPMYSNAHDGQKLTREDFEMLDTIGSGSWGRVVLAKRTTTGKYYAMKVVTKEGLINHKRVNDVFVERNVLTRSNHPFLMKLYWTFQSEHRVYFVMDYMPGGDLESFIAKQPSNRLDMMTTRLYAAEIFLALTHIHKQKVIYRDLKPENILLSGDGHCVLSDFGLSKDLLERKERDAQRTYSFVGSTFYVAPEVLLGTKYGTAVDLWSFGVLLFRMIFGHPPFSGGSTTDVFHKIVNAEPAFPPNSTKFVSSSAIDLLQRLLIKDPAKRITEPEVKSHEFWCGIDWNDIYSKEMSAPMWVPPQGPGTRVRSKNSGVEPTPGHGTAAQAQAAVGTPQGASVLDAEEQSLFHGFSQRAFSCED